MTLHKSERCALAFTARAHARRAPATKRTSRATAPALCAAALVTMCRTSAVAQAPSEGSTAGETPAESRSATFQAVDPSAKKEDVPGGPLLVAAYGVILVLLVAYVARLGALYAKNRGELERLVRAVERGGRKD